MSRGIGIGLTIYHKRTAAGGGAPPPAYSPLLSPAGGTLIWNNGLWSHERMQNVYWSGTFMNTRRYA